jgi:hypothetical protein
MDWRAENRERDTEDPRRDGYNRIRLALALALAITILFWLTMHRGVAP